MNQNEISRTLLIRLSMWENTTQSYLPVGSVIYDNKSSQRLGFVGFIYDKSYIQKHWPAVDPAHLDPELNNGRYIVKQAGGRVPHYFSSFLPGEFGQQLLSEVDQRWDSLSEAEKLYVMTQAHGDFGAPQLNPQEDQYNDPIKNLEDLSQLVQAIREFQKGERASFITREIQGALCSFHGPKPKVDYEEVRDGVAHRFVAKLNTTGYYNDARVAAVFTSVEKNATIDACENRVVPLDCGEEVLFSYNYARTEDYKQHEDGEKYRLILKYNRISFKTLLADDPIIDNTERPSYKHIVYAIDKYSTDPVSDKEELFRRSVLSAATNHTSNGLDNMEMYDKGLGNWRLSPSYHNLPNPMTDTQFELGFGNGIMTGNLLKLDERFVQNLGAQMGFDVTKSLALSFPVMNALVKLENTMSIHELSENDKSTMRECIKVNDIHNLYESISNNDTVQDAILEDQALPGGSFDDELSFNTSTSQSPRM